MIMNTRLITRCAALFATGFITLAATAADYDNTYSGGWRASNDIVNGWDWSLPPGFGAGSRQWNFQSQLKRSTRLSGTPLHANERQMERTRAD